MTLELLTIGRVVVFEGKIVVCCVQVLVKLKCCVVYDLLQLILHTVCGSGILRLQRFQRLFGLSLTSFDHRSCVLGSEIELIEATRMGLIRLSDQVSIVNVGVRPLERIKRIRTYHTLSDCSASLVVFVSVLTGLLDGVEGVRC